MVRDRYRCRKGCMRRTKLFKVVVLTVRATVVVLLVGPVSLHAAEKGLSAETKLVDLPLSIAGDVIKQAAVTSAGMVDRLTKVLSKLSEVKISMATHAALIKPTRLNPEMTINPCFDARALGLQVKITF